MKKIVFVFAFAISVCILGGIGGSCSGTSRNANLSELLQLADPADSTANYQLENKWELKAINGEDVNSKFSRRIPFIIFNPKDSVIYGFSGCNSFRGKYSYDERMFKAPSLAGTMMACPDMESERSFTAILARGSKLTVENGELIFTQDESKALVFTRAKALGAEELAGEWQLSSMEGKSANIDFETNIPTLSFNFDKKQMSGNAGCNTYNAPFTLEKNRLTVQSPATTRMMCPDMEGETQFVKLMAGTFDIEKDNNMLTFKQGGRTVFMFVKE